MTGAQMHIAINQGLQKIGSFQADNFLVEELDLELNKQIQRFVEQRYNKRGNKYQTGFEESQKRIDDIRTLVVEHSSITSYKGQVGPKHYIDSFALPVPGGSGDEDYMHLLNVRALVEYAGCKPVQWEHEWVGDDCECSVSPLTNVNPTFCDNAGGTWVCTFLQTTNRIVGTYLYDDNGDLLYEILNTGEPVPSVNTDKATTSSRCAFAQHDDIFTLLQDPFNNTSHTKPLYTVIGNNLDIYTDNTFVVPSVKVTYLKYPAVVDTVSATAVNCDLPLHTHQEIVDMTVNSLLEAISDPRYQTQSVEVQKSE
mgnify:CR=1 FL=1|tara:strand:+ start:4283 stop:5215 length:933 start_codon:yes stop_codon:yes gene_type:complete